MPWTPQCTQDTVYEFTYEDKDGEEVMFEIPLAWEICPHCDGEGQSAAYLGAITESDRANDWAEDEWENYMSGGYDRKCECCAGTGKVKDVVLAGLPPEILKAYEEDVREEEQYQAMCAMERRMGC